MLPQLLRGTRMRRRRGVVEVVVFDDTPVGMERVIAVVNVVSSIVVLFVIGTVLVHCCLGLVHDEATILPCFPVDPLTTIRRHLSFPHGVLLHLLLRLLKVLVLVGVVDIVVVEVVAIVEVVIVNGSTKNLKLVSVASLVILAVVVVVVDMGDGRPGRLWP
jgi:hypothetical protein